LAAVPRLAAGGILAAALVAGPGCGPIEYINQVSVRAASALDAAKKVGADRYAPYEYTAAAEYLHKAREEGGYAEYQDAIEYGHKAEELAERAKAITVTRMNEPVSAAPPAASDAPPAAARPDGQADPAPARPSRKRPETE
jgi:hypothetical protein